MGLMIVTNRVAAALPDPFGRISTRFDRYASPDYRRYLLAFRIEMTVCVIVTYCVVVWLLRRFFSEESPQEWAERLFTFTLCMAPVGYVLLDRLDIGLTVLMMLAVTLLVSRANSGWSLVLLGAAIAFKFVPLVLLPMWLVAAAAGERGRFLRNSLGRIAVVAAATVGFCLPVWAVAGNGCWNFWAFHGERGIEFQSNYAAVITLFKQFGYPVRTVSEYGSAVLHCSVGPLLAKLSGGLVFATAIIGAVAYSRTHTRGPMEPAEHGRLVLSHALWAMLAFVLFNKTFSPQYVVWLVPLVALVPLRGNRRRLFQLGFLGVSCATLMIYPRNLSELVGKPLPANPLESTGATPFGTTILLVRLALMLLLMIVLARHIFRREAVLSPAGRWLNWRSLFSRRTAAA